MSRPSSIEALPGFRRRFVVTPRPGWVRAEVEDDYHCMSVSLGHAEGLATGVEAVMHRAPWTTCPGAQARLEQTFTGVPLDRFAERGEKAANCTHLHDLAVLAAAHAGAGAPIVFDILVSDPSDGMSHAELRRDGAVLLEWTLRGFTIVGPAELAGAGLQTLRAWMDTLDPDLREAVRLLRWGVMIAHGRAIPLAEQSDASRMAPNCFTFQPEMAVRARRVGLIRDFSAGDAQPLDGRVEAKV